MSHVNIFVIRTISCSSATSHLLTLLSAQININIPCFILTLLCFSALTNCTTKFPLCADNLNIHAWPRGKDFKKNIFTSFFVCLFCFMSCCISVTWIGWSFDCVKQLKIFGPLLLWSVWCRHYFPLWTVPSQHWLLLWSCAFLVSQRCTKSQVPVKPWSDQLQVSAFRRKTCYDRLHFWERQKQESLNYLSVEKCGIIAVVEDLFGVYVSDVIWLLHDRDEWRGCSVGSVSFVFAYCACGFECLCMPKYLSKSWNADSICCSILKAIHKSERLLLMFPCTLVAKNIDIK